jgi:FAD/FMN-containing dehydrogenase
MPVDLGARGSCQIGGMLATNAGGIKVLRYGHMREQLRGLEVVLADGTVLSNLNNLKKNNTGLDLKQIFVGSEGTLGIITRAVLQVHPVPDAFQTALVGVERRDLLPGLLEAVRARFRNVSSLEFVDGETIAFVETADPDFRLPLDGRYASYVIIEEESAADDAARDAFVGRLETLLEDELIADAVVAGSEAQTRAIWRVREAPTETISRVGLTHKFDVTVPPGTIPPFLGEMEAVAATVGGVRAIQFGHLGDGNVHVNMAQMPGVPDDEFRAKEAPLAAEVYGTVQGRHGSISAEHGIGVMKRVYLPLSRTPEEIALMRTLKNALDPKGILNPGVILEVEPAQP